jgi:hypothetical protein
MAKPLLKPWQQMVLEYVFSRREGPAFYLTGEAALAAYYLHHRLSEDLDLFSYDEFTPDMVQPLAEELNCNQ